ncbi:MAG: ABC transporter permease [Gemmataceae bacterium]
MTWVNLVGMAFRSWRQQKTRLILTTLGVVFGTTVLMVSLGLRQGIQATIVRQYQRFGKLREINVSPIRVPQNQTPVPINGSMKEGRRERLQREHSRRSPSAAIENPRPKVALTPEFLDEIRKMDHVVGVRGSVSVQVDISPVGNLSKNEQRNQNNLPTVATRQNKLLAFMVALRQNDERIAKRLGQGKPFSANDANEVIVSEYLLYQLGCRDSDQFEDSIGMKIRVDFRSPLEDASEAFWITLQTIAPDATKAIRTGLQQVFSSTRQGTPQSPVPANVLTISGIISSGHAPSRRFTIDELDPGVDVVLPEMTAIRLYLNDPLRRRQGLFHTTVEVDDINNVEAVEQELQQKGVDTFTLLKAIEREQFTYTLITDSMTVVAVVALLVAGLGIVNTMFMSVLERTREIGIMKAIGASQRHIQSVFLVEGTVVGFIGGVLGMLAAWGISIPADAWVRANVEAQLDIQLEESIFTFPWWLLLTVWMTALGVTTGAAWFPARRASKIDPIRALRGE